MRHDTLVRRSVLAVLAPLLALLALAAPAAAHGGAGVIEVGEPTQAGDLTLVLQVRITYEADGHPAEPEEVAGLVATATREGETVEWPDAFSPGDAPGVYDATLTFPSAGAWDLAVSSAEPPATATLPVTVAAADPSTSTTEGEGTTDTSADDAAPPDDAEVTPVGAIVEQDEGGTSPWPLLAAMAACVAVAAAAALMLRRSRRRPDGPS